jgi:hypothetical protein
MILVEFIQSIANISAEQRKNLVTAILKKIVSLYFVELLGSPIYCRTVAEVNRSLLSAR